MAKYVDGYVIPIKKNKLAAYKKMATVGKRLWMKYGALDYYECVADDLPDWGWSFTKMCKLKKDETAVIAFIVYKSKSDRNKVNKKVFKAPEMQKHTKMPFDMKRFATGGFKVMVGT